jgi:hypothetical protein
VNEFGVALRVVIAATASLFGVSLATHGWDIGSTFGFGPFLVSRRVFSVDFLLYSFLYFQRFYKLIIYVKNVKWPNYKNPLGIWGWLWLQIFPQLYLVGWSVFTEDCMSLDILARYLIILPSSWKSLYLIIVKLSWFDYIGTEIEGDKPRKLLGTFHLPISRNNELETGETFAPVADIRSSNFVYVIYFSQ